MAIDELVEIDWSRFGKKLDSYYNRAKVVSEDSPDEQTKVGAILIHPKSGAVISSGYNGFIRQGPDHILPKTRPKKYEYMRHAEENLITNCSRHGIATDDCILFCTMSPCKSCMRMLYQAGIRHVFFKDVYKDFEENIKMLDLHLAVSKCLGDYYYVRIYPRIVG